MLTQQLPRIVVVAPETALTPSLACMTPPGESECGNEVRRVHLTPAELDDFEFTADDIVLVTGSDELKASVARRIADRAKMVSATPSSETEPLPCPNLEWIEDAA